jgi:hypothetical protein
MSSNLVGVLFEDVFLCNNDVQERLNVKLGFVKMKL